MAEQANPASRPWRRFLRFSVRGLIVLVLVVGAWLGWIVRSARIQREAVAAITNGWGVVLYDWEFGNRKGTPGGKPWAPAWLVELLGVDYFGHVAVVQLRMPALTNISGPGFSGIDISDADLLHLKALTSVETLYLFGCDITDARLVHLSGLNKLSTLDLSDTHVTDSGLVHLKWLTKLTFLNVQGTEVTDAGVRELQEALPNLKINR